MEISIVYQDRQVTLTKPETRYGSNLPEFSKLVPLAFEAVGLVFNGTISEVQDGS